MKMDNQSLSHTIWKCNNHTVFESKYRSQVIYRKSKQSIGEIL
ncbi:hypothetical protein G314FT_09650 [Vagococcus luciliae]|uniref:Transposase n=1 Tax=Vagococcus luciliae TaxID=2920380 RepID=A0ABY5NZF5_9ENTE|nr:hypothetical protein G314FT_09650 [Vagococcus luciliae]